MNDVRDLRLPPSARSPSKDPRYVYKVMVSQVPRQFEYVEAASIAEAEQHGTVMVLVGPA